MLYHTLEKLILQFIYIIFVCLFLEVRREIRQMQPQEKRRHKFSDIQIFHFEESPKASQHILPACGLLLSLLLLLLSLQHTTLHKKWSFSLFFIAQDSNILYPSQLSYNIVLLFNLYIENKILTFENKKKTRYGL